MKELRGRPGHRLVRALVPALALACATTVAVSFPAATTPGTGHASGGHPSAGHPSAGHPGTGQARAAPPGAAGAGDPYFPLSGNGGFDIWHYDLNIGYVPVTGRLDGHAVISATATQSLSRFDLDLSAGKPAQP